MPKVLNQKINRKMKFCLILPKNKNLLLPISIYDKNVFQICCLCFQMLLEPNNHITKRVNTVMGPEFPVTKANLTPTGR